MALNSTQEKILVFGAGGHAKSVYDVLLHEGKYKVAYFVDLAPKIQTFLDIPVLSQDQILSLGIKKGIVAIGDNFIREKTVQGILKMIPDFVFVHAVHPRAFVGANVVIGFGTVVMANAVINIETVIGEHSIVNTSATLEHECSVGNFSSIGPGVTVGGNTSIGYSSAIGIGAMVNHALKIGNETVIGTGSVVITSIEDNVVAYGSPAKVVKSRLKSERYL